MPLSSTDQDFAYRVRSTLGCGSLVPLSPASLLVTMHDLHATM